MERKWFRRNWLKVLPVLLMAASFVWAVSILLKEDNWLAISALATLILAFIASLAIWQTRETQKSEKRERLLNEIIEWAVSISTCVFSVPYTMPLEDIKARQDENVLERIVRRHNLTTYTNLRLKYQTLARKYIYFEHISHKYSEELSNSVKELSRQLNIIITNIQQCIKNVNRNKSENLESLKIDESELHKRADAVIEEATKIKTRDIKQEEWNMSKEDEATGSNEPILKDIEEHLKRQDRQTNRMIYFAGAVFGASIVIGAGFLWITRLVPSNAAFLWNYLFFVIAGLSFMSWCWYKQRKIKD